MDRAAHQPSLPAGRGSFQSFLRDFCHLPVGGALLRAVADVFTVSPLSSGYSLLNWFSVKLCYILEAVEAVFQGLAEALESHFRGVNVYPVNILAQTADFFFDFWTPYSIGFLHVILQYVLVFLFQVFSVNSINEFLHINFCFTDQVIYSVYCQVAIM